MHKAKENLKQILLKSDSNFSAVIKALLGVARTLNSCDLRFPEDCGPAKWISNYPGHSLLHSLPVAASEEVEHRALIYRYTFRKRLSTQGSRGKLWKNARKTHTRPSQRQFIKSAHMLI